MLLLCNCTDIHTLQIYTKPYKFTKTAKYWNIAITIYVIYINTRFIQKKYIPYSIKYTINVVTFSSEKKNNERKMIKHLQDSTI